MKYLGIHKIRTTPYHPQSNAMIERWHRALKVALMARLQSNNSNWVDELPIVLLGLRTATRSDSGVSAAELTYGKTIRLPGDFYDDAKISDSDSEYLHKLRDTISKYKPRPKYHSKSYSLFVPDSLNSCKSVFVRNDAMRRSLQPPYEGPYIVISRNKKYFIIKIGDREVSVSIDRLKPAYTIDIDTSTGSSLQLNHNGNVNLNLTKDSIPQDVISHKTTRTGRVIRPPVRFA